MTILLVVLVIVLIATNVATLFALRHHQRDPADSPDPVVAAALGRTGAVGATGSVSTGRGARRLISIEILNAVELASTRGRVIGIAGSLAPGLTNRIVYEQTTKILRLQLIEQGVRADVHLHTLRPVGSANAAVPPARPTSLDLEPVNYVDEIDLPPG